jgi:hypothetical protein
MFGQIDPLSLPGAGLRHLDFPQDVQGMFEGLFIPREGESHPVVPQSAPPAVRKRPMVRAYGSEQEM